VAVMNAGFAAMAAATNAGFAAINVQIRSCSKSAGRGDLSPAQH
jgi:hypothetical protein